MAKPVDEINALDIVKAVDDPDKIIKCTLDERCCENPSICVIRTMIWEKLKEAVEETLRSVTLKDLLESYQGRVRR